MKKHYLGVLVFCSLLIQNLNAQLIKNKSSLPAEKKWKFILAFDGRRSFVAEKTVKIGGFRIGLQYKYNFRTGIGFYGFDKPIVTSVTRSRENGDAVEEKELLSYGYTTVFFEPILYRFRKWELSLPTSIGRGMASMTTIDKEKNVLHTKEGNTRFFESAFYAENRVFWWAGFGAGIGYRRVMNTQIIEGKKLNGMYYQLAVKFYLGEIVRRAFTSSKHKN